MTGGPSASTASTPSYREAPGRAAAPEKGPRWVFAALGLGLFLALGALFWTGAARQGRHVNIDPSRVDQEAYLNYARKMRESRYAAVGDRNRMPVYPFLHSLLDRPELSLTERFERGKRFNTALAIVLLAVLAIALKSRLGLLMAVTIAAIAAFTVFVYRAPYVQAELLYYTLSFLSFLLFLEVLQQPRVWVAILAGVAAGAAHLTKAALLPGLALFLATMLILSTWNLIRRREAKGFVSLALVVLSFLIVVYPYISTSKKVFGRWFYNVNTTFYMWYDTHEQVMTGTRVHGDRQGWPDLPPEQIPTMSRYLQEHSTSQILGRVTTGLAKAHRFALRSYGYYKFVLFFAGFALFALLLSEFGAIAAASYGPQALRVSSWRAENVAAIVFAACWIGGYLILVAWVSATNPGITRLSLQVFLPLMFVLGYLSTRGDAVAQRLGLSGRVALSQAFCILVLGILCVDYYFGMTHRLAALFAGD